VGQDGERLQRPDRQRDQQDEEESAGSAAVRASAILQRRVGHNACRGPTRVPRFKITAEYAGTRYSGWQIQQNARTVQGELDRAVRMVTGRKDFELYGSGRTDAGVHALAQVAHLDVATSLPADTLLRRLNDELPADINLLTATVVPHRFHARHDAVARRYLYQIATRRTAFAKPYVWWVKEPLDVARMREAAGAFVGMHDFAAFAVADRGHEDALLLVAIEGSHFLWRMVRRLVGVLVAVGRGDMAAADAGALLEGGSNLPARLTAPSSGLFLERVYYRGDRRDTVLKAATPVA
jgi:tRNA pseudouridine38-40 synthase